MATFPPFYTDPIDAAQLIGKFIKASAPTAMDPDAAADMMRAYNALRGPRSYPIAIRPEVGLANPNPADIPLSQTESDAILGRQPSRWTQAKRIASRAARGAAQAVRNGASVAVRGIKNIPVSSLARGSLGLAKNLGGAAAGAGALYAYGNYMGNRALNDPSLLSQYAQDAVNEDALSNLEILNTLRDRVNNGSTATAPVPTAPASTVPAATPDLNTWNDDWDHMSFGRVITPVTRRKGKAHRANVVSTPAPVAQETQAAPNTPPVNAIPARDYSGILISPAQLTPEELNAPESANLAFNRGIHTVAQAPQFSNDDLAVYDWQTGKPRTDIFGFQIRSADPRDHIGDPRWGTITQEMIDNYR